MRLALILCIVLFSLPSMANWQLDTARSTLNFMSIKKAQFVEVHSFSKYSAHLSTSGEFSFSVDLASVKTGIEIRNARMLEHLFNVKKFAKARFVGALTPKQLASLPVGVPTKIEITGDFSIHGMVKPLTTTVMVSKLPSNTLLVSTIKPVMINAADFGLSSGIAKLAELAALPSITTSVPVTFNLVFAQSL